MLLKSFKRSAALSIAILALGGCSSTTLIPLPEFNTPDVELDALYARGIFNWWEVDERYKLINEGSGVHSVSLELIADGQPYDFKLADSVWSPHANCGSEDYVTQLQVNETYRLVCEEESQNVQFTPSKTGQYKLRVTKDPSDDNALFLTVVIN